MKKICEDLKWRICVRDETQMKNEVGWVKLCFASSEDTTKHWYCMLFGNSQICPLFPRSTKFPSFTKMRLSKEANPFSRQNLLTENTHCYILFQLEHIFPSFWRIWMLWQLRPKAQFPARQRCPNHFVQRMRTTVSNLSCNMEQHYTGGVCLSWHVTGFS